MTGSPDFLSHVALNGGISGENPRLVENLGTETNGRKIFQYNSSR